MSIRMRTYVPRSMHAFRPGLLWNDDGKGQSNPHGDPEREAAHHTTLGTTAAQVQSIKASAIGSDRKRHARATALLWPGQLPIFQANILQSAVASISGSCSRIIRKWAAISKSISTWWAAANR